jgi:ribA/ribD-fused uncharacterized protein
MTNRVSSDIFAIYFSPYTAHAIEIDDVVYPTVEHAYQCLRYSDSSIIDEIKNARSPVKAWEISAKYKSHQKPDFKDRKLEVMKMLMGAKAKQHEDVRKALMESGDAEIVKHITTGPPGDGFWDEGEDGKGLNHTGKLWMEIREEMKNIK